MERISRDDLIHGFLNLFAAGETPKAEPLQTSDFSVYRYDEPHLPPELLEKIQELQSIAQSVESRLIQSAPPLAPQLQINYAAELNPQQLLAVTTTQGPLLVIAGAGSGKTRTLIYRLSYLLETGVEPQRILLLTFTRKSAREMLNRARTLLDKRADKVMGGTFHSFAAHVLRKYAKMIQLAPNFTIIDTVDSADILDLIRQELGFAKQKKAFPKKSRIQEIVSKARNCQTFIAEIIASQYSGLEDYSEDLQTIAKVYHTYKQRNQLLDYDDLLELLSQAMHEYPQFRKKLQGLFDYLMVDEFQDTNLMQKRLIEQLSAQHQNIMVVGDDAQSIYSFRGAQFENILRFPQTYPEAKVVKLEQNYRSTQPLLAFSNQIMAKARLRYPKTLISNRSHSLQPQVARFYGADEEAEWIVDQIMALREKDLPLNQIAVLYRASQHGLIIQSELLRRKIPYVVYGGIRFSEKRHVKDLMAYLRLLLNPLDALSWHRILKLLPGVGAVSARKMIEHLHQQGGKIDFSNFKAGKYQAGLEALQNALLSAAEPMLSLSQQIAILTEYYSPLLKLLESDAPQRIQELDLLSQLAVKYQRLDKFLSDFALDPPSNRFQDKNTPLIDEEEEAPVILSTVHSAKGLEWHTVFIPHLLDGLFPGLRALNSLEELEEERRLFYVACTRAREGLYLTLPAWHQNYQAHLTLPSRFLAEMPTPYYHRLQ